MGDACRSKILNFGFFKHERDREIVKSIAFEKCFEVLIDELERSVAGVVLNFDVNHCELLSAEPPAARLTPEQRAGVES